MNRAQRWLQFNRSLAPPPTRLCAELAAWLLQLYDTDAAKFAPQLAQRHPLWLCACVHRLAHLCDAQRPSHTGPHTVVSPPHTRTLPPPTTAVSPSHTRTPVSHTAVSPPHTRTAVSPPHTRTAVSPSHASVAVSPSLTRIAVSPSHTHTVSPSHTRTVSPLHTRAVSPTHTSAASPSHTRTESHPPSHSHAALEWLSLTLPVGPLLLPLALVLPFGDHASQRRVLESSDSEDDDRTEGVRHKSVRPHMRGRLRDVQTRSANVPSPALKSLRRPQPQGLMGGVLFLRAACSGVGDALAVGPRSWAPGEVLSDSALIQTSLHGISLPYPDPLVTFRIEGCWRSKLQEPPRQFVWFLSEIATFVERYAAFGPDFRRISAGLTAKSTRDCIAFYYMSRFPLKLLERTGPQPGSLDALQAESFNWQALENLPGPQRKHVARSILAGAIPLLADYDRTQTVVARPSALAADKALNPAHLKAFVSAQAAAHAGTDNAVSFFFAPSLIRGVILPVAPTHLLSGRPGDGSARLWAAVIKAAKPRVPPSPRLMARVLARLAVSRGLQRHAARVARTLPLTPAQLRALSLLINSGSS